MQSKYLIRDDIGGPRRLHYLENGNTDARTVLCLHGVSRNAEDFTFLAQSLGDRYRVIALDLPGRGQSDWLNDKCSYQQTTYMQDIRALYDALCIKQAAVIGASMGGFLGIRLAAESRCWALGLVDVSPFMPSIYSQYVGRLLDSVPKILSDDEAMNWLRRLMGDTGHLGNEQWKHLLRSSSTQAPDGRWRLAFDPGISHNYLSSNEKDIDLWLHWESLRCPVFVLRAQRSRVLTSELLQAMVARTKTSLVTHELADCGHCPHLLSKSHISALSDWLDRLAQRHRLSPESKNRLGAHNEY